MIKLKAGDIVRLKVKLERSYSSVQFEILSALCNQSLSVVGAAMVAGGRRSYPNCFNVAPLDSDKMVAYNAHEGLSIHENDLELDKFLMAAREALTEGE